MRMRFIGMAILAILGVGFFVALGQSSAAAAGMRIDVHLLWGTDAAKSPNPSHTPVDPEIKKKLKDLPLKWTNYFTVKRLTMVVPKDGTNKVAVSEKCAVEVRDLGKSMAEVSYFGKDKKVEKRTMSFPRGEMLTYGGNAPGTNAWLLVLKRVE